MKAFSAQLVHLRSHIILSTSDSHPVPRMNSNMLTSHGPETFKFNPAANSLYVRTQNIRPIPMLTCTFVDSKQSVPINFNTWGFLHLPGEIRNQIYTYVFTVGTYKFINDDHPKYSLGNPFEPRQLPDYKVTGLALTLVCKQIYYEARSLPYTLNILDFSDMFYTLGPSFFYTPEEYTHLVRQLPKSEIVIVIVINNRRITPLGFPRGPGTRRPWCI
jgi:hypothetical protein